MNWTKKIGATILENTAVANVRRCRKIITLSSRKTWRIIGNVLLENIFNMDETGVMLSMPYLQLGKMPYGPYCMLKNDIQLSFAS
jgi:nicotinate-nucleotide pyrophosphorylase